MRAVRFTQKTSIPGGPLHHPGEVAIVEDHIADRLITISFAEQVDLDKPRDQVEAPTRRPKR